MDKLPVSIMKDIRRYKPVTAENLTMYPIKVAEMDEFSAARPAIDIMQQALPVRFLSMPLLSAYYSMEVEAIVQGKRGPGLLYSALLFLALSLRLGQGEELEARMKRFVIRTDPKDEGKLRLIAFFDEAGEYREITPVQFQRLRPILAAQNGIELHGEDENPELVQAERDLAEARGPKLDLSVHSLCVTLAALSGENEAEMDEWPILKLFERQQAWARILGYVVCGIGEMEGAKWKGGNPRPSPFFDRLKGDSSDSLVPLESFAGGVGVAAVNNPSAAGFNPVAAMNNKNL